MNIRIIATVAAAILPTFAQPNSTFSASIVKGDLKRGKCTVEVVVDVIAEIEIQHAEGRIHTVAGEPATWRRLECNMPLPSNPTNFRFRPRAGSGKQILERSPLENRGIALIRIEDPDRGRENYVFDLEWRPSPNHNAGPLAAPPPPPAVSTGLRNWNDQIDFHSPGDGYFRSFGGSDEELTDAVVKVDRAGRAEIQLATKRRERMLFSGNLVLADRDHLTVTINSGPVKGTMDLRRDRHNRIEDLAMTGEGRNRFELRWQPR